MPVFAAPRAMTHGSRTVRAPLRGILRERRRGIAPPARIAAAQSLARRLLTLPLDIPPGPVAGYWALDGEIALHAWQLGLPNDNVYCLPVLTGDTLSFAPWRPGAPLASNRYGIPEPDVPHAELLPPEAMALVVVPVVGFDLEGHRLGMGGGWYDRSFAFRRAGPPPPILVGAAFAAQQVDALAPAPWDVDVDAVCTEDATHVFTSRTTD